MAQAASGQATLTSLRRAPSAGDQGSDFGVVRPHFPAIWNRHRRRTPEFLSRRSRPLFPCRSWALPFWAIPVQINIAGGVTVASSGPQTLDFTQSDIDAGTIKSVPSGSATPFPLLSTSFTLSANVSNPLINAILSTLLSSLNPIVASLIEPLNAPVSETLNTLGLALGVVDVRVFDVSCKTPTLVG